MLYHQLRLAIIVLFTIIGIGLHVQIGFTPAWYLYLTVLLLLLTHFLFGTVWAAFSQLKRGNLLKAEKLLNQIKQPALLAKRPRAYFHFTRGLIALQKKQLPDGDLHFKKAVELGLRNDTDKALASLNLAHIAYLRTHFESAREYLQKAKSFETSDLMIKENVTKLEKALSKTQ